MYHRRRRRRLYPIVVNRIVIIIILASKNVIRRGNGMLCWCRVGAKAREADQRTKARAPPCSLLFPSSLLRAPLHLVCAISCAALVCLSPAGLRSWIIDCRSPSPSSSIFRESEQERINSSSHHISNINNKQLTKYQVPYLDVACLPSAFLLPCFLPL